MTTPGFELIFEHHPFNRDILFASIELADGSRPIVNYTTRATIIAHENGKYEVGMELYGQFQAAIYDLLDGVDLSGVEDCIADRIRHPGGDEVIVIDTKATALLRKVED